MRIPSAYKVYQVIFLYPIGDDRVRVNFGRAIADTLDTLGEVFTVGSEQPITQYCSGDYPRQLAKGFLSAFSGMISSSRIPIHRWKYSEAEIVLGKQLFPGSRKRGLKIGFPFMCHPNGAELIVPTFGHPRNMLGELGVLLRLVRLGTMTPSLPDVTIITYWDLLNGEAHSARIQDCDEAEESVVLSACSRILEA